MPEDWSTDMQFGGRGESPVGAAAHLDDATLERLAMSELDEAERVRVQRHAEACPSCAALLRGVTMLAEGARQFDSGVPAPARARRLSVWIPASLAAALALAVLVPLLMQNTARRGEQPPSTLRDAGVDVASPIAPAGLLAESPARFTWRPLAGIAAYEVLVYRDDGTVVLQERTTESSLDARPDLRLAPGRYYWRVRALPDESAPVDSPLVRFEIKGS